VLQGTVSGKPYAILCCLIATVCNGAMMTFSSQVRAVPQHDARCMPAPPLQVAFLQAVQLSAQLAPIRFDHMPCCIQLPQVMSEKLDVVRLTFYTAPVSLTCLAPFYWVYEVRSLLLPLNSSSCGCRCSWWCCCCCCGYCCGFCWCH